MDHILFLDNDGGWGGSARSLYYLLASIDRSRYSPIVAMRKDGPLRQRCEELKIEHVAVPDLPSFRPGERKAAVTYALYLNSLRRWKRALVTLDALVQRNTVRLIHTNHESLIFAGSRLARRYRLPWVAHIRTQLAPGIFSRRLYRLVDESAAAALFISEPVRQHFQRLAGSPSGTIRYRVIHNIVQRRDDVPPLLDLADPAARFRVLSLSNFSPNRGVDRIVDVAVILQSRGDNRFAFYLYGRPANRRILSGKAMPYYDEIVARVREQGLEDVVFFPGHVSEPERALAGANALIKLTRQANPWGRDIMEAMAAGVPVITLGTYQGFVEDGINGFVDETFDAREVARHLQDLADDPRLRARVSEANRAKAYRMFNGPDRAREVEAIYESILGQGESDDTQAVAAS